MAASNRGVRRGGRVFPAARVATRVVRTSRRCMTASASLARKGREANRCPPPGAGSCPPDASRAAGAWIACRRTSGHTARPTQPASCAAILPTRAGPGAPRTRCQSACESCSQPEYPRGVARNILMSPPGWKRVLCAAPYAVPGILPVRGSAGNARPCCPAPATHERPPGTGWSVDRRRPDKGSRRRSGRPC